MIDTLKTAIQCAERSSPIAAQALINRLTVTGASLTDGMKDDIQTVFNAGFVALAESMASLYKDGATNEGNENGGAAE